ncbi:hypothetical protein Trydic_g13007 [Trypoxylus dichotomus]
MEVIRSNWNEWLIIKSRNLLLDSNKINSNTTSYVKCRQISSAQVSRWYMAFKDGREIIEDNHRSGQPSTSKGG